MDQDTRLKQLIHPWRGHFDEKWKRVYYHNEETKESVWDLPKDIEQKLQEYQREKQ